MNMFVKNDESFINMTNLRCHLGMRLMNLYCHFDESTLYAALPGFYLGAGYWPYRNPRGRGRRVRARRQHSLLCLHQGSTSWPPCVLITSQRLYASVPRCLRCHNPCTLRWGIMTQDNVSPAMLWLSNAACSTPCPLIFRSPPVWRCFDTDFSSLSLFLSRSE
jgi:hypothetical protein